jgi:HSP20 family protein
MKIIKSDNQKNHDLISRFFDDSIFDDLFSMWPSRFLSKMGEWGVFPKVNISETADALKVVANVPGVDPDKLEIEVDNDILTIAGSVEKEDEEKDEKFYRFERGYGEFRRQFVLPAEVLADNVEAKVKNGVLTIILPKAQKDSKKKIKVEKE